MSYKLSEILIDNLSEMELLEKTLKTVHLQYYLGDDDDVLSENIKKAQFYLYCAVSDLATDLDYKINRHIEKPDFIRNSIKNLQLTKEKLALVKPKEEVVDFRGIEQEVIHLEDFVKQYALQSHDFLGALDNDEIKKLNHKILSIRGKKII